MSIDAFPETQAAIEDGIRRKLHAGIQIFVSVAGDVRLNTGVGTATPQRPIDQRTIMLWRSAGKPITSALCCLFAERGLIDLKQCVKEYLPEFHDSVAGDATMSQLLSHSSAIPLLETGWPRSPWDEIIGKILQTSESHPEAAYQPQATWFLLAEVLQRIDGRLFAKIVSDELLRPLEITEAWCGLPETVIAEAEDRLPEFFVREKGQLKRSEYGDLPCLTRASPGGNFRGPICELGRFYEALLRARTSGDPSAVLTPSIVNQLTTPQRVDQFDATLQHKVDFGLGVIVNSNRHGVDTVPYGFGRYSSDQAFGHGGAQCAMAFCDPEYQLVVAWAANGFCGEGQHQRRNRAINEAIYRDLGLCRNE